MEQKPKSTHTLFCDETGNTGSRFLDPAQPFFAEGGWIISHQDRPGAMAAIEALEKQYGSHGRELKGKDLVRTKKGQALMREICHAVGQNGGVPCIHVVEKRFSVCCKIVDIFFDSLYNPRIPASDIWDPEKRKSDAQAFYDYGGSLIDEFAEGYRKKDPRWVKLNAEHWIERFAGKGQKEFAEKIKGVLLNIESEIVSESPDKSNEIPGGLDSLNLPVIAAMFQLIENHCPYRCEIVHDQTSSFEPIYKYVFELMSKGKPRGLVLKDGTKLSYGFQKACSLSFADSKNQPLIRAADYALSGARRFVELALGNKSMASDITGIAFSHLGVILCEVLSFMYPSLGSFPKLGNTMASAQWAATVFGRLNRELINDGSRNQ